MDAILSPRRRSLVLGLGRSRAGRMQSDADHRRRRVGLSAVQRLDDGFDLHGATEGDRARRSDAARRGSGGTRRGRRAHVDVPPRLGTLGLQPRCAARSGRAVGRRCMRYWLRRTVSVAGRMARSTSRSHRWSRRWGFGTRAVRERACRGRGDRRTPPRRLAQPVPRRCATQRDEAACRACRSTWAVSPRGMAWIARRRRSKRAASRDYMLEVGGEVRTRGVNAAGAAWRIGIEEPDAIAAAGALGRSIVRTCDGDLG